MVLFHRRRLGRILEQGIVHRAVGSLVGDRQRALAGNDQSLELFAAKDGTQTQAAKVTVGLGDDAGI
jgi:hypothetical protein